MFRREEERDWTEGYPEEYKEENTCQCGKWKYADHDYCEDCEYVVNEIMKEAVAMIAEGLNISKREAVLVAEDWADRNW